MMIEQILRHVFSVNAEALDQPADLVAWLNDYHQSSDTMPSILVEYVLAQLRQTPAYVDWPLDPLLRDRDAFSTFMQEQWTVYVQEQTGRPLSEERLRYMLAFDTDNRLQDAVASLVRTGALAPVTVARPERLPRWAHPAVLAPDENQESRRAAEY